VPDHLLESRSGLEHLATPGRHGAPDDEAGVTLAIGADRALVSVMARADRWDALAENVRRAFGLELPIAPKRVAAGLVAFAWAGSGQWLASAEREAGHAFEARLRADFAGLASVSDQSDGRVVLRIGGTRARDMLAKGVMIDLHPRAFGPGDTAVTSIAHIGVQFWQLDDAPTYELAVGRSFAAAFWRWLMMAGAEYGMAVAEREGIPAIPSAGSAQRI